MINTKCIYNLYKINKISNAKEIAINFIFLYEIYFLLALFYFKCNLKNPE